MGIASGSLLKGHYALYKEFPPWLMSVPLEPNEKEKPRSMFLKAEQQAAHHTS